MHELSICIALMQQVERVARENHADGVQRIMLRIGPLSGVEAPLLRRAWPLASTGTIAQDADLIIEAVPVTVRCTQCDAVSEVAANRLLCAHCGNFRTRVVSGDEMLLASMELSKPEDRVA